MKIDKTNRAVKSIVYGSINKAVTIILPFIIRTIIIKYLGTEYVGLGGLFNSILNILNLAELGIGSAIVFSMYKPIANDDTKTINALLNVYKKIYKVIGICVLVVGLIVLPFLKYFINGSCPEDVNIYILYLIYLINTVIGYFFFAYKNSLLAAHQRNDVSSNINTIVVTIMYLCQIIVLAIFKNYYVYAIFIPISTIATNIYIAIATKKLFPQYFCSGTIEEESKKQIKKQMAGLVSSKICNVVQSSIDSICISTFWGLVMLGIYNNYVYIISAIQGFLVVFYNSILAGVGNSIETESLEFNQKLFNKILFMYAWVVGLCSTCFVCLFEPFMNAWIGSQNTLSFSVMLLLVVQFYMGQMNSVVILFKDAKGLWWEDKFRPLLVSLVNLVLTVISAKFKFLEGVVIATILSQIVVSTPLSTHVLFKNYFKSKTSEYYLKQIKYTIVNCIAVAISFLICRCLIISNILKIIVNLLICLVVHTCIFLLVYFRSAEFKDTSKQMLKYLSKIFKKKESKL
jgi:O-antigen/teichoic acid export membrane protein